MDADVVVVGGGVAGAAAASRLAEAGLSVIILERESVFGDRVRGEGLVPWGFDEARAMGLGEVVLGAPGANAIARFVPYDEGTSVSDAERSFLDLTAVRPGSVGIVAVGHPELRQSLIEHAADRGVTVVRGVVHVSVAAGELPVVVYGEGGREHRLRSRLVIGADGKDSAVRRQLGIRSRVTEPRVVLTGMLVDDGGVWDRSVTSIGIAGAFQFFVIPRGENRVRLYLGHVRSSGDGFVGPDRSRRFLAAFRFDCLPDAEALSSSHVVGPCASYEMTDSWTDDPTAPGVVLIGDAAGWSDPVIGQGLAVALRDARVLTDVLVANDAWDPGSLRGYVEERCERMRRLRFVVALGSILGALDVPDRPERRARMQARLAQSPSLAMAMQAGFAGPWSVPGHAFEPSALATLTLA